jgi:multidrug efflux pump subunit AcrA (membrane-fusion protein)
MITSQKLILGETVNVSYDEEAAVKRRKRLSQILPAWFLLLAIPAFIAGCGDDIKPGTAPPGTLTVVKATSTTVALETRPIIYEATGTVFSPSAATLSAKTMGTITDIRVREGDHVAAGDLLLSIDDRLSAAQLNQAKAGLAEARQGMRAAESGMQAAKAGLNLAEATYQRFTFLKESDAVSRQEFDEVEAGYQQARAAFDQAESMYEGAKKRVAQAEAAVAAAETARGDTTLAAPFDGIVTARLAEPGDLASPGTPLIRMEPRQGHEVRIMVTETHIASITIGMPVSVTIPSLQNRLVRGTVLSVDPTTDAASRSVQVKIRLPETPEIRSGMFARAGISVGAEQALMAPDSAIVRHGQLTGVFLIDENHIARFRLVRIGRAIGDQVEILSGLTDGDRIISRPDHMIVDGVKVEAL